MRIQAIINIRAGTAAHLPAKALRRTLTRAWAGAGHDGQVVLAEGKDIGRAVRAACADPAVDAVVIGGGDGSVSRALAAVAGAGKSLGILPLGTMNYVARELGIPFDPAAAATALAAGRSMRMDLGRVNGRLFMIRACLGLLPEFIRGRDAVRRQKKGGVLDAALAGILRAACAYPLHRIAMVGEAGREDLLSPFVMVSNNLCRDGDPLLVSRQRLDGGVLGVYVGRDTDPLGMAGIGVQALLGQWASNGQMSRGSGTWLEIHADDPLLCLSIDGEIEEMAPPLRFDSMPGAVRVLLPG